MNDSEILDLYWDRKEQAITETQNSYGRYCYIICIDTLHYTRLEHQLPARRSLQPVAWLSSTGIYTRPRRRPRKNYIKGL